MKYLIAKNIVLKQILKKYWRNRVSALLHAIFGGLAIRMAVAVVTFALVFGLWSLDSHSDDEPVIALKEIAHPTGIDHWPAKKMVLFADFGGSIYSMQEDGTRVAKLMVIKERDCARVTRVRVDEVRSRLWVMSAAGICVYNLQSLHLIRHLPVGDMSRYRLANGLTDLALDAQGNAYAIDTGIDPIVYQIESATLAVAMWNKLTPLRDAGVYSPRHFPLNALAVTPQGKHLLYVNAYAGTLHVMNTIGKTHSTVSMSHKLYAVNALVAAPSTMSAGGIDLYAVSAGNNSVTVVAVDSELKTARTRAFATKHLDQPLAAVMLRGTVFITNSQLLRYPEIVNEDRDALRPFSIGRMSRKYFAEQAANPILDSVLRP